VLDNFRFSNHKSAFSIYEMRFYDQTFPFLRHKVCVTSIKRFRFYDIKFTFHRSNVINSHYMVAIFSKILVTHFCR